MKKRYYLGIAAILILMPLVTMSAESLAQKMRGKILLAVEDKGKTYYVHSDGKKYRVTQATALEIFKKIALGITNNDLAKIPDGSVGIDPEAGMSCEPKTVNLDSIIPKEYSQSNNEAEIAQWLDWKQKNSAALTAFGEMVKNFVDGRKDHGDRVYYDAMSKFQKCSDLKTDAYSKVSALPLLTKIPVVKDYKLNFLNLINTQQTECLNWKNYSNYQLKGMTSDVLEMIERLNELEQKREEQYANFQVQAQDVNIKAEELNYE